MNSKYAFFFACLLAACHPLTALALINGNKLNGHRDIVRLDFQNGNMCSGVFIDSNTILTSAHCLKNDEKLKQIITHSDEVIKVEHIKNIIHPSFKQSLWPSHDVGIIKTSKNTTLEALFKIEKTNQPHYGKLKIYGCGISSFNPKKRERSVGENNFLRVGSVLLFFGTPNIAPNDSGGPVVDEWGRIVGLSSKTTQTQDSWLPAVGMATSVMAENNFRFIMNHLGP